MADDESIKIYYMMKENARTKWSERKIQKIMHVSIEEFFSVRRNGMCVEVT